MAKTNREALDYFVQALRDGRFEYRDGEVWRMWEPRRGWLSEPRRAEKLTGNGYYMLRTQDKEAGGPFYVMAHRAVWAYFNGGIDDEKVINHKNGVKTDNRIENLELVTQQENIDHSIETGLARVTLGLERPNARLSDGDIRMIRDLTKSGRLMNKEIAEFYGIARPYVSQIKHGKGRVKLASKQGMTLGEYQEKSKRTMTNDKWEEALKNYSMGLAGEMGEIVDMLKKCLFHGHDMDKDKLTEEIGDALFYLAALCTTMGVSLDEVALRNVEKLIRRYPQGFNAADSIARKDVKE